MKVTRIIFGILLFLAVGIYISAFLGWNTPRWVRFYGNDLLCMPIVLFIARFFIRHLYHRPDFYLSTGMIWAMVVFYSLLFEGIFPVYIERYTFDIWDILMYHLGGFFFWIFQKYEQE